jgi:hypothetical protein
MKTQIPARLKLVLILLVTALVLQALAYFTFTFVDNIVHHDLYSYGLQSNTAWLELYWGNSDLFLASIVAVMILAAISIALILRSVRDNQHSRTFAGYVLPFIMIGIDLFSIFIFARITQIINVDLYFYGLQPNLDWAIPLQTYTIFLFALIGIAITLAITVPLQFFFGSKEKVVTEKPGVIRIQERTAGNQTTKITSFILITTGTAALLASIFLVFSILAFIGLGLIFWGILLIYVRTEDYTRKTLLSAVAYPEIAAMNEVIRALSFKGNPLYLPPRYFTNPEICKAYIPKQEKREIPTSERVRSQGSGLFSDALSGLLVTPPGSELTRLFEETLGTKLTSLNLRYLQQNLPKLITERLEIAQNFEMEIKADKIQVKIENSVYSRLDPEKEQQESPFGSTLGSAIACALAKSTGNPIIIEKQQTSPDGKNETIEYRIMDEEAQNIQ